MYAIYGTLTYQLPPTYLPIYAPPHPFLEQLTNFRKLMPQEKIALQGPKPNAYQQDLRWFVYIPPILSRPPPIHLLPCPESRCTPLNDRLILPEQIACNRNKWKHIYVWWTQPAWELCKEWRTFGELYFHSIHVLMKDIANNKVVLNPIIQLWKT